MMKGFMNPLVKSGLANLNRQDEGRGSEEDQEPVRRGRLNRESKNGECICDCKKNLKISCFSIIGAIN